MSTSAFEMTNGDLQLLSEILWGYRHGLLRVETLLEAQVMFALEGRDEQLGVIADMLEEAVVGIGQLDLRREVLFEPSSGGAGGGAAPSLQELAERCDETWAKILTDHHRWFETTVGRIRQLTDQSRHLQQSTLQLIGQALGAVAGSGVTGYDRSGDAVRASASASLFDGRM